MKLGPGKRKQDQGKQQYDENHKKEEIVLDNKKVWKYLTTLAKTEYKGAHWQGNKVDRHWLWKWGTEEDYKIHRKWMTTLKRNLFFMGFDTWKAFGCLRNSYTLSNGILKWLPLITDQRFPPPIKYDSLLLLRLLKSFWLIVTVKSMHPVNSQDFYNF